MQYNPFGLDFGGLTSPNSNYRTRFVTLGDRFSKADSDTKLANFGLRGKLPWGDWRWDANLGYNREDQSAQTFGYVYFPGLQNEVGPSFQNPDGTWGCGTDAAHAIPGCTPINFFNLDSPQTISQLKALNTSYHTRITPSCTRPRASTSTARWCRCPRAICAWPPAFSIRAKKRTSRPTTSFMRKRRSTSSA